MFKKLNNIIISSLLFCGPCCNMLSAKTADTVISANDDYSNLIALDVVDENVDDEEAAGDWSDDSEGDWSDEWEDDDNGFYTDAPAAPKSQFETNFTSKYNEEDDSEADEFEIDASATQTKKPNNIEASASPAPASETGASSKTTTSTETTTYTQKITEGAGSISELEKQVLKDIEDEKNRQKYASLAKTLKRPEADFIKLYSEYGDVLAGLNPNNPKDLAEIEKLIEIVGVPKRESNLKPSPTLKQARADDPIVNFSARNVPVRDAFATLARVSGMSITVSGQIGDRDLISVVEINNQPFTKAFLSLVEAADVDFSASGNAFTQRSENDFSFCVYGFYGYRFDKGS
jgi:hypothetical protein